MLDQGDDLNVGDKITSMLDGTTPCYAIIERIGTAYECANMVGVIGVVVNEAEPSFVWSGPVKGSSGRVQNGWDRFSTEGYEWCRGHEGPPVNRLLVARGLVGK